MPKRIIVISEDLVEPWDEGIKKFAYSVGRALERECDVLMINVDRSAVGEGEATRRVPGTKTFVSARLRAEVRAFRPDAIIYVPSPSSTLWSFVRSFALRRHFPRALVAMVALMPRAHSALSRPVIQGTQPDITLVPSYKSLLYLRTISVVSDVVPVGVDLDTFRPARERENERSLLRQRHHVSPDTYVYLHIGHLSPHRNLEALGMLAADPKTEVILIGSTSTAEDQAVRASLEAAGVRVIRDVMPVEEFYRLADCYVFPVHDAVGCVEMPLSVLEALASGLPVLSRSFGGLRDFLPEGDDLGYFSSYDDLAVKAARLRANGRPRVRDMRPFSWSRIAERILFALENRA
jgi:glycosyltransferase involved in cell wall biosynthesis